MARRPRTSSGEAATHRVTINLTPSEKQTVQALAGTLSLSDYFRRAGLQLRRQAPVPEVNRLLYLKLDQIAQDLRQIAQHKQDSAIDPSELQALQHLISQVRWELIAPAVRHVAEDETDRDW